MSVTSICKFRGLQCQVVQCYRVRLSVSAEELAKEPPNGRFPDWLNLRVQRPKVIAQTRLRGGKRGKPQRAPGATELKDAEQTFEVSE